MIFSPDGTATQLTCFIMPPNNLYKVVSAKLFGLSVEKGSRLAGVVLCGPRCAMVICSAGKRCTCVDTLSAILYSQSDCTFVGYGASRSLAVSGRVCLKKVRSNFIVFSARLSLKFSRVLLANRFFSAPPSILGGFVVVVVVDVGA